MMSYNADGDYYSSDQKRSKERGPDPFPGMSRNIMAAVTAEGPRKVPSTRPWTFLIVPAAGVIIGAGILAWYLLA